MNTLKSLRTYYCKPVGHLLTQANTIESQTRVQTVFAAIEASPALPSSHLFRFKHRNHMRGMLPIAPSVTDPRQQVCWKERVSSAQDHLRRNKKCFDWRSVRNHERFASAVNESSLTAK
ncbi:unnamed protein product, partial [Ectocarpus sp. 12 AP-2014]